MRALTVLAVVVAGLASVGCGENCQSSCQKIYDPSECGVQIGGVTSTELTRSCISDCQDALANTGPMGDYDPFTRRDPLKPKSIYKETLAGACME